MKSSGAIALFDSACQLDPVRDADLAEDVAEVGLDRLGADEELRGDLGVGAAVPSQPGDVLLLRRELIERVDPPLAHLLAGGEQLMAGPLGERLGTHLDERLIGGSELLTSIDPAALTTQPLSVDQLRSGQLRPQPRTAQSFDRLVVVLFCVRSVADQRA